LASVMAYAVGAKSIWGLRASNVDFSHYDWFCALSFRIGALLSPLASCIIVNSVAGKDYHRKRGYMGRRMVVVPNGIDTDLFRPNRGAGRQLRRSWEVADREVVIGLVARLDPMKDHPTFL